MDRAGSSKQRLRNFRKEPARSRDQTGAAPAASGNGQTKTPQKSEKRRKYLKDYARWLWPYRWQLVVIFVLATLVAGLDNLWPLLIKFVMDLLGNKSGAFTEAEKLHRLN